jgi:hypothetical protein
MMQREVIGSDCVKSFETRIRLLQNADILMLQQVVHTVSTRWYMWLPVGMKGVYVAYVE